MPPNQEEISPMLNEPTIEKLQVLRLQGMLAAWQEQGRHADVSGLGFDERFALLVEAEWLRRENERLVRNLREAKLRLAQASLEDLDYAARRELDRAQMRQLATCRWVTEHQNVLLTGATGTGKTFVACALAHQACRHGHRALYRRASRLYDELTLARADGTYARVLARLARVDVLIIDDFALAPLDAHQRQDLLEILEDRHGTRSSLITSQLPVPKWHAYLDDPTLADAICDRLLHNAHRVVLKGPSRRKSEPTPD
jgi:DNA replication protein DnaC